MKKHFLLSALIALIALFAFPAFADAKKSTETHTITIEIDTPPTFLFPYLIEEEKTDLWSKDETVEVSYPTGIEPRVGKQIRVTMKKIPTQPWVLLEIIKLEKDREVLTRFIDGGLEGEFAYILEPLPGNRTKLVHEIRIRPKNPIVNFLWEIYGKRAHRKKMGSYLQKLKQVAKEQYQEKSAPMKDTLPTSSPPNIHDGKTTGRFEESEGPLSRPQNGQFFINDLYIRLSVELKKVNRLACPQDSCLDQKVRDFTDLNQNRLYFY